MILKLVDGTFSPDSREVECMSDFDVNKRVFYEIGKYVTLTKDRVWINWVRSNIFEEITDVAQMLRDDEYLNDPEYRHHHHFYVSR